MEKVELVDIQKYGLEVLCAVRDICVENNIPYSLTGGTLIGAIRHRGFIPWDDDIDIMIPRPDYDRLISIMKDNDFGFDIYSIELCGDKYQYPFAKACHKDTVLVEKTRIDSGIELGVSVDIFPIDGIGDTYKGAKIRCMFFQILHGLKVMSSWNKYHTSKLRKWYYEPLRYICYLISRLINEKSINKGLQYFVRKRDYYKSDFVGRMVGDYGSKEVMAKSVFENKIKVQFENEVFDAIAGYDFFLKALYGDYMKLPPLERRVTHHEFEVYKK